MVNPVQALSWKQTCDMVRVSPAWWFACAAVPMHASLMHLDQHTLQPDLTSCLLQQVSSMHQGRKGVEPCNPTPGMLDHTKPHTTTLQSISGSRCNIKPNREGCHSWAGHNARTATAKQHVPRSIYHCHQAMH